MIVPPPGLDADELVALMWRDKKALDGLTFVLDGPSGVEVVNDVDAGVVRTVLERTLLERTLLQRNRTDRNST